MAHPSIGTGGKEKRRFARLSTSQAARIRFGDGADIPAKIRDYCPAGLYVALLANNSADVVIPALMGAPVRVEFEGRHAARFVCSGRVARIAPGGVGVMVTTMPEGALQALRSANGRANITHAGSGLSVQQTHALLQACDDVFRHVLDAALEDFFQQAAERLGDAAQDEPTFLERSRYDNAIEKLQQQRGRIAHDFFAAMGEHIQRPESIAAPSETPTENSLALVEEDEFEDWLNLSAVIDPIEKEVAAPLHKVGQRYGRLVGQSVGRKSNPFGPEVICRTFQGALQGLDFSNTIRAMLYKALGQAVVLHVPVLYSRLEHALGSLQPLEPAQSDRGASTEKAPDKPAARSRGELDLAEIARTLDALFKPNQAGMARTSGNAEYSLDHILASLNKNPRSRADSAPRLSAAGVERPGGAATSPAAAWPDVLRMVGRLQQTSRQLTGSEPAVNVSGSAVLPDVDLRDLLMALDRLQQLGQDGPGASSLADRLEAHITTDGPDARRLSPAYRQILDTTSELFSKAQADFVPSSDVELLVKRLERPLLKLALQDPGFPSLPDHPARQMLNLIEQYAVAADDKGKLFDAKLQRFLTLLVERVCEDAGTDSGIFERVTDTLERVLLPILEIRRKRVARLQEGCEGRERIRSARARVNAALEQRLAGREVPGILLRLLDAGWRQYLVLLEMRQGPQGDDWDAALGVLDRLLDMLCQTEPVDEPRNRETAQVLLGDIERALATVNVDIKLLDAFIDELAASLIDFPAHAEAGSGMVRVPPGRLSSLPTEGGAAPVSQPLADRLRVGDWWDFSIDGNVVPMQLIWISHPPSNCAFANRSATNNTDLSLAGLARQMQRGQAKPGKDLDLPLIERSEQALFDETYQGMVRQAIHDPVTGLLNRKGFTQHLERLAMPDADDRAHTVAVIEFDQFRVIYNACGLEAAENLARGLASEVRAHMGPDAVLAAFRDDTLALLLPNWNRSEGERMIDGLLDRMKDYSFRHGRHSYSIGSNIGITEFAPDRFAATEAIRRADSACITAKSLGRNRMQVYEQASPQLLSQESLMDWAGRIDAYLKGDGLHLRCQQVMPLGAGGHLPYYEVLLGIEGAGGVKILPTHFIPAVERLQRAHEVDIWVMRNVFEWIAANKSGFDSVGGIAINLSATSLSNPDVKRYLQTVLPASDFPTDKIIFEITESAAIESYGAAQDFIRDIRRYGCKFSLDDFGSGFTSYAHLKNLRTDALKIDGSFVKDMLQSAGDFAMVKSMNDIGHSLGMRTVAEYVESPEILNALREIGVDYVQGYAVHKPCRIDEILLAQAG